MLHSSQPIGLLKTRNVLHKSVNIRLMFIILPINVVFGTINLLNNNYHKCCHVDPNINGN